MKINRARKPNHVQQSTGQLRVIGGQWRGRKLSFPPLVGLRPTGDRIRETLFNWLQTDIPEAQVLDLFAGSGALGIEALSRGCAHCTLLELQTPAVRQLQQNLTLLNCQNATVINADALAWLALAPTQAFDIVFIDPPFAGDLWDATVAALDAGWLASNACVYVESNRQRGLAVPDNWQLSREKSSGDVSYRLYRLL